MYGQIGSLCCIAKNAKHIMDVLNCELCIVQFTPVYITIIMALEKELI